jgi:hypothetical protein
MQQARTSASIRAAVQLRPSRVLLRHPPNGVASGVPSSQESEWSGQRGRRQDVLDHDPGAKVAFGSERQIAARPGSSPLPIDLEQRLKGGRPPRDRRARIEGCRPEPRPHGVFVPGLIDA